MYTNKTDFIKAVIDAELSPVTKRVYLERLRSLMKEHTTDIYSLIRDPQRIIAWIHDKYASEQTRKSYISAILAVFRHNKGLKEQEKEIYTQWYAAFTDSHNAIEERYKRNEPTQKQKDVYVPFDDIVKARDGLVKGSIERLLFAFYTYLPPLRCDFNKVRIYDTCEVPNNHEDNYIHICENEATLILNEYKTKSKKDVYKKTLPVALIDELKVSLKKYQREWLFVDKNGQPFVAKSYTQWANRIFARVLHKRMTVSMFRHSFINSLDFNTLTVAEKEAIAHDMAHTVGTQDRYRLIFKRP